MITKKDSLKELKHRHFGNNLAVVQWLPSEMCYVTEIKPPRTGRQLFKIWTKLLSVFEVGQPLKPGEVEALKQISDDLSSGRAAVINTRLVYAQTRFSKPQTPIRQQHERYGRKNI